MSARPTVRRREPHAHPTRVPPAACFNSNSWKCGRRQRAHQDPSHDHDPSACSALSDENQIRSFNMIRVRARYCAAAARPPNRYTLTGIKLFRQRGSAPARLLGAHPPRRPLQDMRAVMRGVGKEIECGSGEGSADTRDYGEDRCTKCNLAFKTGDVVIEAALAAGTKLSHEQCFRCSSCSEQLAENNYYEHENDTFCGRCHAEMFLPRCAGCDELIFDSTYTVAEGKKWHQTHFCCWVCDTDLCERQYAKDPENNPVCLGCYNERYAVTCATCKGSVGAGEMAMRAGDLSYHHTPECFRCKVRAQGGTISPPCRGDRASLLMQQLVYSAVPSVQASWWIMTLAFCRTETATGAGLLSWAGEQKVRADGGRDVLHRVSHLCCAMLAAQPRCTAVHTHPISGEVAGAGWGPQRGGE